MSEDFLHFIWKFGLFDRDSMVTDTGDSLQILSLGEHNTDAGPDFLNARIKIGHTIWAGNIEIHLKSSDWVSHGHDSDRAYDNVILHVVGTHDYPVKHTSGENIPTHTLQYNNELYLNYSSLVRQTGLSCKNKLMQVDPIIVDIWLHSLVIERIRQKTESILQLLSATKNNWEEAFYITMARSFGFGLNADPFEMIAKSIPFTSLIRHRNNLTQIEALLFGQAGFLDDPVLFNDYYCKLRNEYLHLKKKYDLRPPGKNLWKFLRLRPVNFPTIRIAQFAAFIQKSEHLFSAMVLTDNLDDMVRSLNVTASEFWHMHYTFETVSPRSVKNMGIASVHTVIINSVIPFLFLYGKLNGDQDMTDRAIHWLSKLPPEENRIVAKWKSCGIEPVSAFYSQALLQLNNSYCARKRCLSCSIGAHLITAGSPYES